MVRIAAALASVALFGSAQAAQQPSAATLYQEFDLFGSWAPNCAAAPSLDNPHVTVAANGLHVLERDDFGSGYETNRYDIVAAKRMDRDRLAVDVWFAQAGAAPQRQLIIIRIEKHTRRTMFTGTADGPPRVKDGIAVAAGKPTPVLNKCD